MSAYAIFVESNTGFFLVRMHRHTGSNYEQKNPPPLSVGSHPWYSFEEKNYDKSMIFVEAPEKRPSRGSFL